MKILVACEESQAVTREFRRLGHEAYSCDIAPCSGGHPEWHLQQDVLPLLKEKWDMIIAFPPCTDLAVSGARHFEQKRKDGRQQASIEFFMLFANHPCERIAIENPVGIMSTTWKKPNQIIQPYEYGHPYTKKTCLWLKGLPLLQPTCVLEKPESGWENQSFTIDGRYGGFNSKFSGAKARSKTFPGIAKAFATQYTAFINSGMTVPEWENLFMGIDISRRNAIIDKYVQL